VNKCKCALRFHCYKYYICDHNPFCHNKDGLVFRIIETRLMSNNIKIKSNILPKEMNQFVLFLLKVDLVRSNNAFNIKIIIKRKSLFCYV